MRKRRAIAFLSFLERQLKTAFFVFVLFGFYTPSVAILSLFAAAVHEAGHLLSLYLLGKKVVGFERRLNGFVMECKTGLSYREERIVALSGPLANFLAAGIAALFLPLCPGYLADFIILFVLTGLSNLLPVEGYDGGRILASFLSERGDIEAAHRICRLFSLLFILVFLFLSLFVLLERGQGYFIFSVFFVSLLSFIRTAPICEKQSI